MGVKNFGFTEKQKNIEHGSRGYPGPGGVLQLISPLILLQLCIDFTSSSCLTKLKELHVLSLFVSCVCKRRWWLGGRKCRKIPESNICVCRKAKVIDSHIVYMLKQSKKKKKKKKKDFESLVLRKFRKITAISHP